MASFDPGELNMIMNRGFEGSPQPLIPVYINRVTEEGIQYHRMMQDGQNLMTIGEISAWCAGSLSGTRDIFFSSVVANAPDDPYNGAAGVRVTWWGEDGNGRLNLRILDQDGNVLPNINYNCYYFKESSYGKTCKRKRYLDVQPKRKRSVSRQSCTYSEIG